MSVYIGVAHSENYGSHELPCYKDDRPRLRMT